MLPKLEIQREQRPIELDETTASRVRSREAFETFYLNEYPAVVGLAYVLSGRSSTAEDLAQEAFLAAHINWDRIARYDEPGLWVRRVVANLSVSAFRRARSEARALARLLARRAVKRPEFLPEDEEFWGAVRTLPRRQAQVVALHYLEDRPIVEIAAILGVAPGTVKKHLFEGRQTLARTLRLEEDDG
jgi:RNA polymerase sigma-70 factor (ECF subfamily)